MEAPSLIAIGLLYLFAGFGTYRYLRLLHGPAPHRVVVPLVMVSWPFWLLLGLDEEPFRYRDGERK